MPEKKRDVKGLSNFLQSTRSVSPYCKWWLECTIEPDGELTAFKLTNMSADERLGRK